MRKKVVTRLGEVAYLERGRGEAAVFIHGMFLNGDLWQRQLDALSDLRRCIALDLLAHGESAVPAGSDLTMSLQADMVMAFLDALDLARVDLVGNDSGGAIAQIVATTIPERVRSLTLTNCDTHDNWPPAHFAPIHDLADQGLLADSLAALATDTAAARAVLTDSFEDPAVVDDATLHSFFAPFRDSPDRARAVQGYVRGMDNAVTVAIADDLARLRVPTLIVWGADDPYFDLAWSRWLTDTIPGTVGRVEVPRGRLFHPFERPAILNRELRDLWINSEAHTSLNRYLDAWNRHDLHEVISWHTDDTVFCIHTGEVTRTGRDAVLDAFGSDLEMWPDVRWRPLRRTLSAQTWVLESVMTATAAKPLDAFGLHIDPGQQVSGRCVDILSVQAGRIARKDTYLDPIQLLTSAAWRP